MLLEIWIFLIILGFAFIVLGQIMRADVFRILGVTIIFLMAFPMLSTSVDYKTGSTVTTNGGTYTVQDTYDQYGNHTIGFLMASIAFLGLTLILVERRRQGNED